MILDDILSQQSKQNLQKFLLTKFNVMTLNYRIVREGKIDRVPFIVAELLKNHHVTSIGYFFKKPHPKLTLKYKNLLFLRKHGFSRGNLLVPKPLFFQKNIFLRTPADGINYGHASQKNLKILFEKLPYICNWLKKLHRVPVNSYKLFNVFEDNKNKYHSYYKSIAKLHCIDMEIIKRIQKKLLVVEKISKPAFIHNDLHPENIFFHDGKITVIDFDSSGKGDPLMDIGYFLSQVRFCNCIQKNLLSNSEFTNFKNTFVCQYFGHRPDKKTLKKILLYEARSDFRLLGFLSKFIIPQTSGREREYAVKNTKKLVQLLQNLQF